MVDTSLLEATTRMLLEPEKASAVKVALGVEVVLLPVQPEGTFCQSYWVAFVAPLVERVTVWLPQESEYGLLLLLLILTASG
jgi:hypothetical protein